MAEAVDAAAAPLSGARPRIVAVGGSAGGLEPIQKFFELLPPDSGAAFIVVQHLSPDFRSMMPELLRRHCEMPVRVIETGMRIEPNAVFLNSPRSSVSVSGDTFTVRPAATAHELNLPINDCFQSVAERDGAEAVCVVMSGTGSDGAIGAEKVAQRGGSVFVQEPETAKFDSMPRCALERAPGAVAAPPAALAALVAAVLSGRTPAEAAAEAGLLSAPAGFAAPGDEPPERGVIRLLQARFGLDFSAYKTATVGRRVMRRAALLGRQDLADYVARLEADPDELEALYADLLIGVTAFFRDRAAFDLLDQEVLPALAERMASGSEVRVWTPGCASGEEPYSIAILLAEHARKLGAPLNLKIFATDIHPRSLKIASRAIYAEDGLLGAPPGIRERYFAAAGDMLHLKKEIREKVVFSKHNLIQDPPFTRVDLISCRNLMIYFNEKAQRRVIAKLHFALNHHGALFLGPSESLGDIADEFTVVDSRWRLYRKRRDVRLVESALMIASALSPQAASLSEDAAAPHGRPQETIRISGRDDPRALAALYDAVIGHLVGAAVLIDGEGRIRHVFADGGRHLTPRPGRFSTKLADNVDDDVRIALSSVLEAMRKRKEQSVERAIRRRGAEGAPDERLTLTFTRLSTAASAASGDDGAVLVSFKAEPVAAASPTPASATHPADDSGRRARVAELERDLAFAEETLRITTEQLETSNEELQAINEELQSTNEELMASNEELQTVNEELQSVNEELFTVSAEHQEKINELVSLTNDLDNLLESTTIGVLFLDSDRCIRSITPALSKTFNILDRDVGRPISHVTLRFEMADLESVIDDVIREGRVYERNIEVEDSDYLLKILPYRRDGLVDGAVLTFVDISDIARANRALSQFADIVSHDLKAPLRAIRTASEWIVEDLGEAADPSIREHVGRLVEQTDRLSEMLVDLRDYTTIVGSQERAVSVDMDDLLADIARLFEPSDLQLVAAPRLPKVSAPRAALRLVFQNLIDNSVKHGERRPVRVEISAETGPETTTFFVSDDGPGIEPRHHARVFLPFRKLKSSAQSAGSGIGLALVKKTVEDRGGSISVRSDPDVGPGATFVVVWPNAAGREAGADDDGGVNDPGGA